MTNQKPLNAERKVIAEFATQEASQETNSILLSEGFSSSQSTQETLAPVSDGSVSQIKTQGNALRGALTGGISGALIGLLACIIRVRESGIPFLPTDSGLSILSVSLAAGVIGAISVSLIGVISASKIPTKPLPNSPKVASPKYTVTVTGDSEQIERATEIISANGGKV